jgi:hypothetical protein
MFHSAQQLFQLDRTQEFGGERIVDTLGMLSLQVEWPVTDAHIAQVTAFTKV